MSSKRTKKLDKRGGRAPKYPDHYVINLLKKENPKRPGTKCYEHFKLYRDGMTVADYLKVGGTRGDVNWDVAHGFIKVVAPAATKKAA